MGKKEVRNVNVNTGEVSSRGAVLAVRTVVSSAVAVVSTVGGEVPDERVAVVVEERGAVLSGAVVEREGTEDVLRVEGLGVVAGAAVSDGATVAVVVISRDDVELTTVVLVVLGES